MKAIIVGYGLSGKTFHLPLLRAADIEVEAVAVSRAREPDPEGGVTFIDFQSACADKSVDLVVITSPNELHCEQALAAIAAGKHVVIEKPMATSERDAERIGEAAQNSGKLVSVFHNRRWDGDFLTVKKVLDSGAIGAWKLFESRWGMNKPIPQTRWKDRQDSGGGLLMDFMPHLVDQALCMFGVPDYAHLDSAVQRDGGLAPDFVSITLHYGNRRATLTTDCFTMGATPRFRLAGTEGEYRSTGMDSQESDLRAGVSPLELGYGHDKLHRGSSLYRSSGVTEHVELQSGDYLNFYRGFISAVEGGKEAPVGLTEARCVVSIVEKLASHGAWKPETSRVE